MSWDTLGVESILIPMYATKKVMGYLVRLDNVKLGSVTFLYVRQKCIIYY